MQLNELKNSRLVKQIIIAIFDKNMGQNAYSLEHPSVNVEEYEQIFEMIRSSSSYRTNFQPIRYWIYFYPSSTSKIEIVFNNGNKSSNASVLVDVAIGTIETMNI